MIYFGEAEVFKRKMAQSVYGFVGRQVSTLYLLKELANRLGVHASRLALDLRFQLDLRVARNRAAEAAEFKSERFRLSGGPYGN